MFTSYCKIAWRNFTRNRISSFINVLGLSIGMAVAMLNGLWIRDEMAFDHYHENHSRIARLMAVQTWMGEKGMNNSMSYPMALAFKARYADHFKHIVFVGWPSHEILGTGETNISGTGTYMTQDAPAMLTLHMQYGTRNGLNKPSDIMLAASLSKALFGNADPTGRTLSLNKHEMRVTGVYEDLPKNSSFADYQYLAPFALWVADNPWISQNAIHEWDNHFLRVYAEILPGENFDRLSAMIKNLEDDNRAQFRQDTYTPPEDFLFPMDQWHLYPYKRGTTGPDPAPIHVVRLVGLIGAIVLLLACINFMNMSTARSEKRAREVGIRKTIGSDRKSLILQFYSESFFVVFLSFCVALLLLALSLGWFNDLAAKDMSIPWTDPVFWSVSGGFIVITALLAGSYPALYLSSFRPIKVLKGRIRMGRLAALPRRMLVTLQFTASVILVICTIIVDRQIQFGKNRPVGYTREGLIAIEKKSGEFYGKYNLLRDELKRTGAIAEMSESMGTVTELWSNNNGFYWTGMHQSTLNQSFGTIAVSARHGATIGWQILQGRDFSPDIQGDSAGIVMNQAAARYMGIANPVGMNIGWKFQDQGPMHNYVVLGVTKDMLTESPYNPIRPTFYFIRSLNGGTSWINIRLNPAMPTAKALAQIQKVFKQLIPSAPFEYKFVDEEYAAKFAREEQLGKLAAFFGSLAIFISCLGLFGLATFIASRRIKEIGIRKVLGASVFRIWRLLSKEFVYLTAISCAIAIPIAWLGMHSWIQNYTYRTSLSWWIFGATTLGAILITLCTVSIQSIAAALKNPIESLKTE